MCKESVGSLLGRSVEWKDAEVQVGPSMGSYNRNDNVQVTKYEDILLITGNKDSTIEWLKEKELIAAKRCCPTCGIDMCW